MVAVTVVEETTVVVLAADSATEATMAVKEAVAGREAKAVVEVMTVALEVMAGEAWVAAARAVGMAQRVAGTEVAETVEEVIRATVEARVGGLAVPAVPAVVMAGVMAEEGWELVMAVAAQTAEVPVAMVGRVAVVTAVAAAVATAVVSVEEERAEEERAGPTAAMAATAALDTRRCLRHPS
eukprot:1017796-Prymnesium_polylepis.1